jgi:hypothetical protein
MQPVQTTLDELQTETRDEMARLYKLAQETLIAAAQHETKLLALSLLEVLDEHPEVTSVQFEVNWDYERRENRYYSMVDFTFNAGDEQVTDDWTYMHDNMHGWSQEGAEGLGDEDTAFSREYLREKAGLS